MMKVDGWKCLRMASIGGFWYYQCWTFGFCYQKAHWYSEDQRNILTKTGYLCSQLGWSINRLTLPIIRDGRSLGSPGTQTQASGDGIAAWLMSGFRGVSYLRGVGWA
jgi:hypothetical protein